ncbi:MAG TPA: phosphotransferase [Candidatus Acidoferrales bacterium]|nr:phosphotransferase [Candidatus Acidoferrales bacterium]
MPAEREPKPAWSQVPISVRREAERRLGSRVSRATRAYGGYAASATFRLVLANGRRAFFKAGYPPPPGSAAIFPVDQEDKRYRSLAPLVGRWMPKQYASFRRDDWYVLLMEDLGPAKIPPWSSRVARLAMRSYARFHRATLNRRLPRFLSRTQHGRFGAYWRGLEARGELERTASLAGARRGEAREWLDVALPILIDHERELERARPPFALLHFDTRSDNIRLVGQRLVMFDWPFASVGPPEFDVVAFAQGFPAERGPAPERALEWYEEVLPLRPPVVDACLAGISGYFAHRSWQPPLPGLPRLRSVQRRQLKACLRWCARRFELPEPRWLAAVQN